MEPLKVLIVGAGIAGPSLASWLARTGAEITLIERYPQLRSTGQQLDVRAQGVPVMKKLGIEAAIRAKTIHEPGTQLIDTKGRQKAFFGVSDHGGANQSLTTEYEIMRGDLVKILMGLTEGKKNVKHRFGTTVTSLTQDGENDPKHMAGQSRRPGHHVAELGFAIHGRLEVLVGVVSSLHRSQECMENERRHPGQRCDTGEMWRKA